MTMPGFALAANAPLDPIFWRMASRAMAVSDSSQLSRLVEASATNCGATFKAWAQVRTQRVIHGRIIMAAKTRINDFTLDCRRITRPLCIGWPRCAINSVGLEIAWGGREGNIVRDADDADSCRFMQWSSYSSVDSVVWLVFEVEVLKRHDTIYGPFPHRMSRLIPQMKIPTNLDTPSNQSLLQEIHRESLLDAFPFSPPNLRPRPNSGAQPIMITVISVPGAYNGHSLSM